MMDFQSSSSVLVGVSKDTLRSGIDLIPSNSKV